MNEWIETKNIRLLYVANDARSNMYHHGNIVVCRIINMCAR